MDKNKSKEIVSENNINTPKWVLKHESSSDILDGDFDYPLIIKPNDQGSTIGLSIVKRKEQLKDAFNHALQFADSIIFESYIVGREITVPIIGSKAYPIVEIIPSHDLYDYECKYTNGMSQYICPAELSDKLSKSIKDLALKIHTILDCRHYSRVDFLLDSKNEPWFLELNTLPGMTETSLLPKSLKADGIEFKEIIQMILNEALEA
jgi:D-alanine-D-alanine ligase